MLILDLQNINSFIILNSGLEAKLHQHQKCTPQGKLILLLMVYPDHFVDDFLSDFSEIEHA